MNTVSFFAGRGKKTAWDIWGVFPELTATLLILSSSPEVVDSACLAVIERFVVLLYDRTSNLTKVNETRQKKSRMLKKIPPTQEALIQDTKRSMYQGGHIWAQALVTQPVLLSPSEWEWQHDNKSWTPVWMTLRQMTGHVLRTHPLHLQDCMQTSLKVCQGKLGCKGLCNCGDNCN